MRINFLYRWGDAFPWSMGQGFINALEELGHTVISFEAKFNSVNQKPHNKAMLEFLQTPADLILVMGGGDKYCGFYADEEIMDFMCNAKIPRITYFMESMFSRKRTESRYVRSIKCWSHILTVDETDIPEIKKYGCENVDYVPGWVDEKTFHPIELPLRYEFQFIGFPHIHRQPYIEYLQKHLRMVNNHYPTVKDYVGGINETKILVGLPSVFKGFTQRVSETLACGKVLLYPSLPEYLPRSRALFEDKKHIVFYNSLEEAVELARHYSKNDSERKKIERASLREILDKHTIIKRAQQFIMYAHEGKI